MQKPSNALWACKKIGCTALVVATAVLAAACAPISSPPKEFTQDRLDDQLVVPPGNVVALETTATGLLNYECKANPNNAGAVGWVLVSPEADLVDRTGNQVAKYSGPPATWTHMDGSRVGGPVNCDCTASRLYQFSLSAFKGNA